MAAVRLFVVLAIAGALAGCATHAPVSTSSGIYRVGNPYEINGVWYTPREQPDYDKVGIASWYGPGFDGHLTADGEIFDQDALTAAHTTLPLPVNVRVTNLENGRSLVVRVNDRGPFEQGRIIDVSEHAAELLGFKERGTARVRVEFIGPAASPPEVMVAQNSPAQNKTQPAAADVSAEAASTAPAPAPASIQPMAPIPNPTVEAQALPSAAIQMAPIPDPAPENDPAIAEAPDNAPAADATDASDVMKSGYLPAQGPPAASAAQSQMFVQIGSFNDVSRALALYNEVLGIGKVVISPSDVGGQRIYRVRLGPVASADEISRLSADLKAHGHTDIQIVMQ